MNILGKILANELPTLIVSVTKIIQYIAKVKAVAQQAGEWSAAQEDEFQAMLDAAKLDPAWQPDPKPAPPADPGLN